MRFTDHGQPCQGCSLASWLRITTNTFSSTTPRWIPPSISWSTGPNQCLLSAEGATDQCDRKTDESMPNYRYYSRRLRRLLSQPAFQLLSICALLFFGIRWVIRHNHDDEEGYYAPVARPMKSVEDPRIDWSKLYYVQYVTSPEYLCNALMVWSEIEEIGSRAQRQERCRINKSSAN